ncbi:MAG: TldD/PmbA family protein [Bacillota bacterium]|nr:MAG: TldD/PmbA family protein [Bacillota bacterium]
MSDPSLDDVLELALRRTREMGAVYADVRLQDRRLTLMSLTSRRSGPGQPPRESWEVSRHAQRGLGVRVIGPEGGEGFSAATDLSRAGLARVVSEAMAGAASASRRTGRAAGGPAAASRAPGGFLLGPPVAGVAKVATPRKVHPEDVGVDEKRDFLRTYASEAYCRPETSMVSLAYADSSGTDVFASSEGSRVETDSARVVLHSTVEAERAGDVFDTIESLGGVGGLELLAEPAVKDLAGRLASRAADWLGAGAPPGGEMTAILDNQSCENFVHEAVGHSCEADAVEAGASVMAGKLGVEVGAPGVTVVDDPGRAGTVGMFLYDDEGVKAQRVTLIEDGVLKGYLHTRQTAAAMGVPPNGHARARDFGHLPIVRMGTISLEAGDHDFDELLEGVGDGIYLMGKRGGQVDPARGVFQFRPDRARLIQGGELGPPVRAPSLSGSILDILRNMDAIGDDLCFHPGGCGKGFPLQVIPAGSGSPHVRIRRATIGGEGGRGR